MTNERIDHAGEATKLLGSVYSDDPEILDGIRAQVHATLALVEQQRIANEIALRQAKFELGVDGGGTITIRNDCDTVERFAAALGLEGAQS